jgi:hypothetical protein
MWGQAMRKILRKLEQNIPLQDQEYEQLMDYIDQLRQSAPESYALFCQQYGVILYEHYSTYLPRFPAGMDELIEYLVRNPSAGKAIGALPASLSVFPPALHPYLMYMLHHDPLALQSLEIPEAIALSGNSSSLPEPRKQPVVCKFEDANINKETGLRAHFDRLSRFTFVSRLQSYRYLTRHKAAHDRIEVVNGQCLGGIFTNKEKSIYYYIFLTEDNLDKAHLACQTINSALYGSRKGS